MTEIFYITQEKYDLLLKAMAYTSGVVFVLLFFVRAGYGIFRTKLWGRAISNRKAWVLMEVPAFIIMLCTTFYVVDVTADQPLEAECEFMFRWQSLLLSFLFMLHYFQRSFVFPYKMKGKSKMPIIIMLMGILFNALNAYMIGMGMFRFPTPELQLSVWKWILRPNVIVGILLFFVGMLINMHSDRVIRHLRHSGDNGHYLPTQGLYKYVTSANYFGEIVEWIGFALAAMIPACWLFVLWTAANLIPRAHAIHRRYRKEFGEQVGNRKRIIPFIY